MVTNKLFAIGIPTVNRADLLNPTLEAYVKAFPNTRIFIVDNGMQDLYGHKNILTFQMKTNIGCVKSWNWLCGEMFNIHIPYLLMLNDDVRVDLNETAVRNIIDYYKNAWLINSTKQWSSFIMPLKTFREVGRFDEIFHSYYADNDYERRLKKRGREIDVTRRLDPHWFMQSGSTQKDPMLNLIYEPDRVAYVKKWGGEPGRETFEHPYNEET